MRHRNYNRFVAHAENHDAEKKASEMRYGKLAAAFLMMGASIPAASAIAEGLHLPENAAQMFHIGGIVGTLAGLILAGLTSISLDDDSARRRNTVYLRGYSE